MAGSELTRMGRDMDFRTGKGTGRGLVCALSAACLWASPAWADVKAGVDAWGAGNYAAAVREWRTPAEAGDPDAIFNLAQAYKLGRGVEPDIKKAEELYAKAAARGHLQAADNYGLLLFDRGERARAMPYVSAAAQRGDPRAQYLLGLSYFNADNVPKDWIRAYALVSLAQQAGLPQAAGALAQMDKYIPLEQRQQSVALASELAARVEATRNQQLAAADLGVTQPGSRRGPESIAMGSPSKRSSAVSPEAEAAVSASAARQAARGAGADYTRTRVPEVSGILAEEGAPAQASPPRTPPKPPVARPVRPAPAPTQRSASAAPPPPPAPAQRSAGAWRVQLGAFGVRSNADGLWNRVRARPELSGHARIDAPAGKLIKLQAGGFASQAAAQQACNGLKSAGFTCIPVSN
jgi:cell division protein FtsN